MKSIKEKRKWVYKHFEHLKKIDPSEKNYKDYIAFFDTMNDEEFDQFMTAFLDNENSVVYLEMVEYENDLKMENIEVMAESLNIPLYETVVIPYETMDGETCVTTPHPVPVGYMHDKRMVQLLLKKNAVATGITKRNSRSGQVSGKDKTSRTSDVESYSMLAIGAEYGLRELLGERADDMMAKNQMYNRIQKDGYYYQKDLDSSPEDKVAINTLDVYFVMQGLKTNLVHGGNILVSPEVKEK